MAETETPNSSKNVIKVEEEVEGDQTPSKNYRFSEIGEPVPINSDADYKFDMDSLPSCPLAVSERFEVIFVAHSSGFCVARTKDVIDSAKNGSKGSCIQDLSLVDISIGKVSILALSADSSVLAAIVGFKICFFSVAGFLNKDHEPSFSKSLDDSCCIKDMQWSPHLKDKYVVLTNDGNLYSGAGQDDLNKLMDNVDAVGWSKDGKFLAVAINGFLRILSSKFEEKLRIKLPFDSLIDNDPNCVVKVDSVRWVRPDCIMLGCFCLTADGKEENYQLQLISVENGEKITNPTSSPVALTFSDAFISINDDDIPSGSGPYLLASYLNEYEVAFVANKKNTNQHIVLFAWSANGSEMIDIEVDSWLPVIKLQDKTDEDNMILGLAMDKVYKEDNVRLECGELGAKAVSPCCILMCLTVDGKLVMFHFASATDPSVLPEDSNSVSNEEEEPNIVDDKKQIQDLHELQTQTVKVKVKVNEPSEKPFPQLFKAPEPVNTLNQEASAVNSSSDSVSKSANEKPNKSLFGASAELQVNKPSFSLNNSSKTFSSGPLFSSNVFGAQSSSSSGSFSSGGLFSSRTFDVKPITQPPHAAVQQNRPDSSSSGSFSSGGLFSSRTFDIKPITQPPLAAVQENRPEPNVGPTQFPSGPQKFSFSKMSSGSSNPLPQGTLTGPAVTRPVPIVSNAQPSVGKSSDKGSLRSQTQSRLLNSDLNFSEQCSVEEMAKELDDLLYSIEEPGGFFDASVAAHKPSVAALEDGIYELSDRCQYWTETMHRGSEEVQLLFDKTVQVLARKIYMEAIVKQATDSQYLDIWNRQKLSSELDMKRRHILEMNQNLTNQLIELERHLNTLELQRFGDKSDVQMNRKSFHMKQNPPRHIQSLHSLHNTMNAQLTAAEKLSECLSKQMAVLSIDKEPVKKTNVKKQLFDTIGISYDDNTFTSPNQEKSPKSKILISSSSSSNTNMKKGQQGAVKSFEPETARRCRDSLDKNWASIEPPKTTVKRLLLQEEHQTSPARLTLPTTTQKVNQRLFDRSVITHGALNMSQNKDSQDTQIKRHSEEQLNSSMWSNYRSESLKSPINSVLTLGSGSQSTPVTSQDAIRVETAEKSRNRLTFTLKSDPVAVNDPKSSQQSQSFLEPSSNNTKPVFTNIFQKKPIESSESSINKDTNQRPVATETSSIWSKKSQESPFFAVSSASSSTAFSGKSFSLEASLPVPVTLAPSSSTSAISLGKSLTGFGNKSSASQTAPVSGPSSPFPSFSSTTSSIKPTANIDVKSEPLKLNPDTSESSKSNAVSAPKFDFKPNENSSGQTPSPQPVSSVPKFDFKPNENSSGQTSSPQPVSSVPKFDFKPNENPSGQTSSTQPVKFDFKPNENSSGQTSSPQTVSSVPSGPTSQPSASSFSGSQLNLVSNPKPEQTLVSASPVVSTPSISKEINGSDLAEDEMEEEAPETAQLTLGSLGGFGLGSSPNPNPSVPKQNPFGGPFGNTPPIASFTPSPPTGGLFRPASFNVESQQPSPPPQQTSFGGFGSSQNPSQSSGGQGFGQPATVGSGQQALGSVLGSFGQSRQFGASSTPFGGGFGGSQTSGGFATASSGGGGFASLASGGGGFGGLAAGGGSGFAAAAATGSGGGFGAAATGASGFGGGFGATATGTGGFGGGFGGAATGTGGFGGAPAVGGGFGGAATGAGGFGGAPAVGGGFGGLATGSGGGFGGAPTTGGGFGGAASGSGGFGGFSSQGGTGTGRPPSELFTQMRK